MRHRLFFYDKPALLSNLWPYQVALRSASQAAKRTKGKVRQNAVTKAAKDLKGAAHTAAADLAATIVRDLRAAPPVACDTFAVLPAAVDAYASRYLDRWIEGVAHHAGLYAGVRPPLLPSPRVKAHPDVPYAELKGMSGDVSGAIGEALFVATMIVHYGVNAQDLAHLKLPGSSRRLPDFTVNRPSGRLNSLLGGSPRTFSLYRIPAEVKTVATVETASDLTGSLRNQIEQLLSYWSIVTNATALGSSLLFLAMRNPARTSYDVALIHAN